MPSQEVQDRMDETGLSEEQVINLLDFEAEGNPLDFSLDNLDFSTTIPDDFQLGDGVPELLERNPTYFSDLRIQNVVDRYGLSKDDIPDSVFDGEEIDPDKFNNWFSTEVNKNRQEQRDSWDKLHEENPAAFADVYNSGTTDQQLNFLYDRFEEGTIDRKTYSQLAGQALTAGKEEWDDTIYWVHHDDNLYAVDEGWADNEAGRFFSDQVVLHPDQENLGKGTNSNAFKGDDDAYFRNEIGQTNYENADVSSWVSVRDSVLVPMARTVAAIVTGGKSEKLYTGYKVATGEPLTPTDYVNIIVGGLEASGVISPPVSIEGDTVPTLTGTTGDVLAGVATDGVGLFGMGYDQTVSVLNAIANGDPIGAIAAGTGILQSGFEAIGIPPELANDPDFIAAATNTLNALGDGEDLQQALEDGFVTYVGQGGGFGVDLPDGSSFDLDLGALGDAFTNIAGTVSEFGSAVGDYVDPVLGTIGDAGEVFKDFLEPVIQVGQDVIEAGSEVVGDVSSAIGDVTDPITGAIGDAGSALDDTVRSAGSAVGDYLDPVWSFIGDNLVLTPAGAQAQQQQQRTPTQNLFDSELKSIGSISLSEYAPLLTGDQRRHAPVGTAANPARQQPQTAAESLLKPLSTQFAGQLAQDPIRQQMEKDRLASQGSLYGNFNSNPFASPFDTEEEEGLI